MAEKRKADSALSFRIPKKQKTEQPSSIEAPRIEEVNVPVNPDTHSRRASVDAPRSAHRRDGSCIKPDFISKWKSFTKFGRPIEGTNIIPFKTPLASRWERFIKKKHRFRLSDFLCSMESAGTAVGLVVDLTDTFKYYDGAEECREHGVKYVKIRVRGQQVPPESQVAEFCRAMEDFLSHSPTTAKYVAVHCTHGVNRTGYFLCRYLESSLKIECSKAMELFQSARGHPMERAYLVERMHNPTDTLPGSVP
eukprot:GILK01007854.1.p1 GENE.GILK01007854.1~~GILK01007854.1.p1  ORF type:complete len:251 (+),score=21.40 GILK01007854.1:42-794(+)